MTKVVPIVPEAGNTILPQERIHKKQISPAKRWTFTYNNYTESDYNHLINTFSSNQAKFIIGKEVGKKGTPHLQGYLEWPNKIRPKSIIKIEGIHWECAKGNKQENIKYCSKEGKYETNLNVPKPIKILEEDKFWPWQKELLLKLKEEPDDRHIYWIWDGDGGAGKSAFAKHMCMKYNCLIVDGKSNDIFNGLANYYDKIGEYPEIIIVDCPRANFQRLNYGALEKLKNGLVFTGKYESKQMIFNSPHVVILANEEPIQQYLSLDRWIIKEIRENGEFK